MLTFFEIEVIHSMQHIRNLKLIIPVVRLDPGLLELCHGFKITLLVHLRFQKNINQPYSSCYDILVSGHV